MDIGRAGNRRRHHRTPLPARVRRQRGFTLIEMLVVISILGILAGVVTMSMIGLTSMAQQRAQQAELMAIQSAMNFMIMDQGLDPEDACSLYAAGASGTDDMAVFPSNRPWVKQGGTAPPGQRPVPVQLYQHYLRKRTMSRRYVCTGGGTVTPAP
jgi:prepilin-type N-terminal cleavage/methylation domain-containing protein